MNILIIGLGQSLRGDDSAGLEAVRRWQVRFSGTAARLRVETAGLPGLGLLDLMEGMDAVLLVDAVQADAPPGTLLRLGMEELAAFTPGSASAHGWGVAETLQLGFSLHPWLAVMQVILIGIVGEKFELGAEFSPGVNAALEEAVMAIETEARNLLARKINKPGKGIIP
jgi:hydrogenase maturation protease